MSLGEAGSSGASGGDVTLPFLKFAERHRRLLNAYIRRNTSLLESSLAPLLRVPKLIDFDNKRAYFRCVGWLRWLQLLGECSMLCSPSQGSRWLHLLSKLYIVLCSPFASRICSSCSLVTCPVCAACVCCCYCCCCCCCRSKVRSPDERTYGSLRLNVKRQSVFEDSFNKLRSKTPAEMRAKLSVSFVGEEGIDAGGVSREWYQVRHRHSHHWGVGGRTQ